jgi:acyl carrier protein
MPSRALQAIDAGDVTVAVTNFINATIMARGHAVQPDDDLEAAGVDSMALLKVLLFIEAEFGFWIPDEDLVDANVRSSRALATYVARHRAHSRLRS